MGNLLPCVTLPPDQRLLRSLPLATWLPAIRAIAHRHGLILGDVTRFPSGDHPVFASGNAWVLKLVPPGSSEVLAREIALQRSLPADIALPVPTMLGQGALED